MTSTVVIKLQCECGSNMHTNYGVKIHGLKMKTDVISTPPNTETEFSGFTENWICPKCGNRTMTYFGWEVNDKEENNDK